MALVVPMLVKERIIYRGPGSARYQQVYTQIFTKNVEKCLSYTQSY